MEMEQNQPAWTPVRSIVLHRAVGTDQTAQSAKTPTPDTHIEREFAREPQRGLSLNLDLLYISYVRTSQIWFCFFPMLLIEGVMLFCTTGEDLNLVEAAIERPGAIC